tara:strand:+ start:720 stop:1358 length:639 start_codon:yes stop_codon:yes gene_type:complete
MSYACLIFDLDGTLSDSRPGIAKCINSTLIKYGYDAVEPETLSRSIGQPLDAAFRQFTKSEDEKHIAKLVADYRKEYGVSGYIDNTLYDGIKDILFEFKDQNIRMGVCTSKPERFARPILEMFDLMECFDFLSGGDVGIEKAQQLKKLREQSHICKNSIMIGDSKYDIIAAKENGLPSAGVLWGYGSAVEIESHKPEHVLKIPEEIAQLLTW